jgi:hypothetical protein
MATSQDFETLFAELRHTRNRYEDLRISNASLADRADTINQLHTLRSAIAELRMSL